MRGGLAGSPAAAGGGARIPVAEKGLKWDHEGPRIVFGALVNREPVLNPFCHGPLARRISLAVGAIASLLALSLGIFLGLQSGRNARAIVSENLEVAVRTLSVHLAPHDLDALCENAQETDSAYLSILAQLKASGKASLRKATFYTLARTDSGWIFLTDAYEGEDHSALGSRYEVKDPATSRFMDKALETGSANDPRLVEDKWGVWMSAYARVPGTDKPVLVGVDIPASDLRRNELKLLLGAVLFSVLGALGAALATRTLVHRTLARELGRTAQQVSALQTGDLAPKAVTATGDELEAIGHALNETAAHLRKVVSQEIVDWNAVSQRLEESALLALLMEHSPAPLLVISPSCEIRHFNAACRKLLGLWGMEPASLLGKTLREIHPGLSCEATEPIEFQQDGCDWVFRIQSIRGAQGEPLAMQGNFTDLTQARLSEKAQRESQGLQDELRAQAQRRDERIREEEVLRNRELSRQIDLLLAHVDALKEGDLSGDSPTLPNGVVSQLAQGLDSLVDSLRSQMSELLRRSEELTEHSSSMRESSLSLGQESSRTREEVGAARSEAIQAQASLDQATRTCQGLVEDISHLTRSSQEAVEAASQAGAIAGEAARQVQSLEAAGIQIARISSLVTDIARQTSLLAINAAVEAAHAGKAGAGFAVVAAEVQALSTRTSEATASIDQSIQDIRNGTGNTTRILANIDGAVARICTLQQNVDQALLRQKNATEAIARETRDARTRAREVDAHLSLVEKAAARTAQAADQGLLQAQGLAEMSGSINDLVARFRT